jgi:hypothetical protein
MVIKARDEATTTRAFSGQGQPEPLESPEIGGIARRLTLSAYRSASREYVALTFGMAILRSVAYKQAAGNPATTGADEKEPSAGCGLIGLVILSEAKDLAREPDSSLRSE